MTQEQGRNFMTAKEKQNFFSKEKKTWYMEVYFYSLHCSLYRAET